MKILFVFLLLFSDKWCCFANLHTISVYFKQVSNKNSFFLCVYEFYLWHDATSGHRPCSVTCPEWNQVSLCSAARKSYSFPWLIIKGTCMSVHVRHVTISWSSQGQRCMEIFENLDVFLFMSQGFFHFDSFKISKEESIEHKTKFYIVEKLQNFKFSKV